MAQREASGHDRVVAMASGAKIEFANKQGRPDNDNPALRMCPRLGFGVSTFSQVMCRKRSSSPRRLGTKVACVAATAEAAGGRLSYLFGCLR